jgi:hypothetical protein
MMYKNNLLAVIGMIALTVLTLTDKVGGEATLTFFVGMLIRPEGFSSKGDE